MKKTMKKVISIDKYQFLGVPLGLLVLALGFVIVLAIIMFAAGGQSKNGKTDGGK